MTFGRSMQAGLAGLVCSRNAVCAAETIQIDENRWVSIGAGSRAGFTSPEQRTARTTPAASACRARIAISTSGDANLTGAPGAEVDTFSFGVQIQI